MSIPVTQIAMALGLLAAGIGVGQVIRPNPRRYDFETGYVRRAAVVREHAGQIAPGQVAVIGDSLVERQRIDDVCGLDALNAGVSSAKAGDVARLMVEPALSARPSRAVLAVGTNDFREGRTVDLPAWGATIRQTVDRLPPRPIIVGIGALPGTNAEHIAAANAMLRQEAQRRQGDYVEPVAAHLTTDGIHLSPAGIREWQARIAARCDT